MKSWYPTRSRPFSAQPKTLIVAENWRVLDALKEAFRTDAEYRTYGEPLVGKKFNKIVAVRYCGHSQLEAEMVETWIREAGMMLCPDGTLVVVP